MLPGENCPEYCILSWVEVVLPRNSWMGLPQFRATFLEHTHAEQIFNLMRAYVVREGLTREHDNWPKKFYQEPLPEGSAKGTKLPKKKIRGLLEKYYKVRGWDKKTGIPTRKKLKELCLDNVSDDLLTARARVKATP